MGHIPLAGHRKNSRIYVYQRGNQFSNSVQMAGIGVLLMPITGLIP